MRIGSHPSARRRAFGRLAIVLATPWLAAATCEQTQQIPLTETERAVHLLSRTTYGVRPGDVEALLSTGTDAWLERQLHPETIDDVALEARLAAAAERGPATRRGVFVRAAAPPDSTNRDTTNMANRMRAETAIMRSTVLLRVAAFAQPQTLVTAKMERAVHSARQLEEVMTDFWFNHFNVFFGKGVVRMSLAAYERDAIRVNVFGRFEDMLRATAQHPAMLVYLDNYLSTAADPADPDAKGGLNENYARELLELHTLGVDGGYTQQDVVEVARAFTGWTISGGATPERVVVNRALADGGAIGFEFQAGRHDRGEKVMLGHTLAAGRGIEDGLDVLSFLAAHPSTAQFIATKLVRHFVADLPPPELVEEIAEVFTSTGGDLREVTRALFTSEQFYQPANYRAKTKRPFEFVASVLRLTGAEVTEDRELYNQLRAFGHVPYNEAAPTGFPTEASEWLSAGAVLGRINFATDLAAGRLKGVQFRPESAFGFAVPVSFQSADQRPAGVAATATEKYGAVTTPLLGRYLYGVQTSDLDVAIAEDLAVGNITDPHVVLARAIGLVLGSPHFQRY
jgi:uncharacterized protein (DUF1800 family)